MKNKPTPQNYFSLMTEMQATIYETMTNELNQEIWFLEHPIHGDIFPIIVAFPDHKVAFVSDFYDLEDMTSEETLEYRPFLWNQEMILGFELESLNPQPILETSK